MGENTAIEWCDHTFNPWVGCTKVSGACDNCYAEGWAKRTGQAGLWAGDRRRTSEANWRQPIKWNAAAKASGTRPRVFCASLADVFDNQVPAEWRSDLFDLISITPELDWLLLTKRPQNIRRMLRLWHGRAGADDLVERYPNVWLGTTTENQEEYNRRWECLREVPARVRFISYEPALGPLTLMQRQPFPNWVIAGGESGPKARAPWPEWFYDLRQECAMHRIPFLFKQWGEHRPLDPFALTSPMVRVGKKRAGRLLAGVQHDGYPA